MSSQVAFISHELPSNNLMCTTGGMNNGCKITFVDGACLNGASTKYAPVCACAQVAPLSTCAHNAEQETHVLLDLMIYM